MVGSAACTCQIPDIQCLHLITDLDTAHTFDTFVEIAIQGERLCPCTAASFGQLCLIRQFQNAQIVGNILQLTVAAAHAGRAFAVMLRQNQLHIGTACITGTGRIGMYHHALFYRVDAGCNHGSFPFDLYTADTTGGNFVDIFQIAQGGILTLMLFAASMIVVPSGTCATSPSIVNVTIRYSSLL